MASRRASAPEQPPPEVARALARARRRSDKLAEAPLDQWFSAITRMRRLSARHGLGLHEPHPDILDLPNGGIGQIGYETVRIVEPRPKLEIGELYRGLLLVDSDYPEQSMPLYAVGELIPRASLPVMVVSLAASDEHILAEVERVLRSREKTNSLHRTTEAQSITRSVGEGRARQRWWKHHIVELVELLAWRQHACKDKPQLRALCTNYQIGLWITKDFQAPKHTSQALAVAKQAILTLPQMLAEVQKLRL